MPAQRSYDSQAFNSLPFREKLDILYDVSARDRRDLILASPEARRLVRSFAAESLFYTLKDLGLQDGVDLIALASGDQMAALVDLDCWKKDRVDTPAFLEWLEVILEGGSEAVGEFLHSVDLELLILFLKRFIRVYRKDDPEEPPDVDGPEVFELDEHYQIVFHQGDTQAGLVRRVLEALYERDYSYFVTVMEEAWWGVESDLEEASFRLRNARLQDRGFPDYYEAQDVYRPLEASSLPERSRPLGSEARDSTERIPQDRTLVLPEDGATFFSQVMHSGFDAESAEELRHELAHLTNRILVAEGVDFSNREEVSARVRLAHDTVNLALEVLTGGDLEEGRTRVAHHYVQHLFQVGRALLGELRRDAKRAALALGLPADPSGDVAFLDSPHREALAGCLAMKPVYFRGLDRAGEVGWRAFGSANDLARARALLEEVAALPDLAEDVLGQPLAHVAALRPAMADEFRISAAILTGLAGRVLGREASLRPIAVAETRELRRRLDPAERGALDPGVRASLLEGARGGAARFLAFCLARLEDELLRIAPDETVDPRFVTCLMLESRPPA